MCFKRKFNVYLLLNIEVMKMLGTLVMALLMSFSLFAQESDQVKLEKEGDLVKATYFHDNGEVSQIGYFKNDKPHGEWKAFDITGDKIAQAKYDEGKKVGKWFFWNDGSLSEVDYRNNAVAKVSSYQKNETYVVSN